MQQLRYLDLTSNKITSKSVEHLIKLKSLTHLYLSSNKLSATDIRNLIKGLVELSVGDFRFNGLKE
jgi:Leucine-rich repeat (LRR) protein